MSTILALDASEWQGDLTRRHFEYAYALGVRLYICQLWGSGPTGLGPNDYAVRQLEDAVAVGMFIAGYTWLPPAGTTDTRFLYESSLAAAGRFAPLLSFIAPDLEGERLHPTDPPARLRDFVGRIKGGGHPVVIYSRKNNWSTVMGAGVTEFSSDPLWEARYYFSSGSRPDVAPSIDWSWVEYGGWRQRAALQYAGTAPVNGWSADWNVVDTDRFNFSLRPVSTPAPLPKPTPVPPPLPVSTEEDDDMTKLAFIRVRGTTTVYLVEKDRLVHAVNLTHWTLTRGETYELREVESTDVILDVPAVYPLGVPKEMR